MTRLRPNLGDIRYREGLIGDCLLLIMTPLAIKATLNLVRFVAARQVYTLSDPEDGSLDSNDRKMQQLSSLSPDEWETVRAEVLENFELRDGRYYLIPDWIEINKPGTSRPGISPILRMTVLRRDGFQCGYCGTTEGPFDIDHVVPLSRGGAHDAENMITACCKCNRSKSDKLTEEWLR